MRCDVCYVEDDTTKNPLYLGGQELNICAKCEGVFLSILESMSRTREIGCELGVRREQQIKKRRDFIRNEYRMRLEAMNAAK